MPCQARMWKSTGSDNHAKITTWVLLATLLHCPAVGAPTCDVQQRHSGPFRGVLQDALSTEGKSVPVAQSRAGPEVQTEMWICATVADPCHEVNETCDGRSPKHVHMRLSAEGLRQII